VVSAQAASASTIGFDWMWRCFCRRSGGVPLIVFSKQLVEPGITVGVDYPSEVRQVSLRVLAFAVGRVEEQSGRRLRTSKWLLVADIGPQSAGFFGLASTWRQDRHRGVIDMKGIAGQDLGSERVDERLQRCRRGVNPSRTGSRFPG
jgi:hypothetical protein